MNTLIHTALAAVLFSSTAYAEINRDTIRIVGSSTVYPFAVEVAERFSSNTDFKRPDIQSTGSGGGLKLFCAGVGSDHPDISNASRRIKNSESQVCEVNGVKDILEVPIGYDGIVLAGAKQMEAFPLTRKDLYLAVSRRVPDPSGEQRMVKNPYNNWQDINPSLPAIPIEIFGPPESSGTRDAFRELVMEPACEEFELVKELKQSSSVGYAAACDSFRRDGPYTEGGENDEKLLETLQDSSNALAIFGYSLLQEHNDQLQGMTIDGVQPTFDTIADGTYPLSRPLFFYVKEAHLNQVVGLKEYIKEFTADSTSGAEGYLTKLGLIPLSEQERTVNKAQFKQKLVANTQ
ncbi:MAG: substrate-binding domain-containing protein [Candidatus Competibacteraceae bacterium]|jgi:phosphate transport system substrate-binding protein|nr:substrate-binding domain-containing protein [Candidatus Competibacteraceae bacterium]